MTRIEENPKSADVSSLSGGRRGSTPIRSEQRIHLRGLSSQQAKTKSRDDILAIDNAVRTGLPLVDLPFGKENQLPSLSGNQETVGIGKASEETDLPYNVDLAEDPLDECDFLGSADLPPLSPISSDALGQDETTLDL